VTETKQAHETTSGQSRSAVGRVTLLVEIGGGTETVSYERRLPDAEAARAWCEDKLRRTSGDTAVLDIQVTEEVWGRRHAWEATANRHIAETLQLGVRTTAGDVVWGAPHVVGAAGARRS
jgi:hypothetical protein